MTQGQKRNLIQEQLKETPEKSDRQIANALGVSPTTVGNTRHELEDNGHVSKLDTSIDTLGRKQPRKRKPVSVFNPTKREEKALQNPEVVARLQEQNSRASLSHLAPLSAVVISTYKNINAERF